nr:electron transport complex subunit RsxC [uncultured Cardiobacterium sp.]
MIKQLLARLLPGKPTFHGGIHITPSGHKTMSTARPSREAALCDEYAISLIQHDGTPFIAQVTVGDRVLRGQLLAAPANHRDAPVHAPTSGTIRAIEPRPDMHPSNCPVPHLILASDGEDQSAPPLPALDIETATPDELRARIHDCGIVGLGGAGFPTARKLGHPANTLVINAAECEPYITCDDLQIRENAAAIIKGAQITARILGADNIHFGIEDDKPEAIAALHAALDAAADPRIRISSVPVRYPSGNARQLFELLLGIRVPADAHASDYGLICHNSGTMKAVYDAVSLGLSLTERYTTISGEGIREPQVLRIRIGTAARELIQQSGGERHEHSAENRHIIGGPMMGYEIASLDTPLQKTGNSLLILPAAPAPEETPCIRCSRCADACPMELLPQQLLWYSQSNQHNRLKQYRLFDCIECGICAAVCPSGIPLVQYYRHSKGDVRAADKKAQDAEHARARHEARTARLEREAAERQAQMDARRAKLREAAANPAPAAPPSPITRQDPNPPEKYTPNRPPSETTTASDDKTAAIEAAKARAAARKAARLAASDKTTEPTVSEETNPSPASGREATEGGTQPPEAATSTTPPAATENIETLPATSQIPPSETTTASADKIAAIEAAKARAAARKAARLAASGNSAEVSAAEEKSPSPYGGRDGMGVEQTDRPSEITTPPFAQTTDPAKSAAIEAAKARAAARKAERLAASDKTTEPTVSEETNPSPASGREATEGGTQPPEPATSTIRPTATENVETLPATSQTPPSETTEGSADKTAAIEAAKARAAARRAERLAVQTQTAETPPSETIAGSADKSAAIEAAKARAAARKAARLTASDKTTEPTVSEETNPSPASGREATEGGTQPPEPATSTIRPTATENVETLPATSQTLPSETTTASADKTAAIEAAKARAAARKAARLTNKPNKDKPT